MIMAYSVHERDVLENLLGDELGETYGNLLKTAKQWRRTCHAEEDAAVARRRTRRRNAEQYVGSEGNRLIDHCKLAGISIPTNYGVGKTTERMRYVIERLERCGEYDLLTRGAKRKWTNVLAHNRFDCEGLQQLCRVMISER